MSILKSAALLVPAIRRLHDSRHELQGRLATAGGSVFDHYHATFDARAVVLRHAVPDLRPTDGYLTNFLGVLLDPRYFPGLLDGKGGQVEGVPIPANWHADLAEWAAALRAVELSRDRFTVLELGCGWGCWLNNAGAAARRLGRDVRLIGIEGDEGHVAFAHEATAVNGFAPGQVTIHRGVAAADSGVALFPRQAKAGVAWGLEPVFGATEAQRRRAAAERTHDEVPMIALGEILAPVPRLDLLHVDIQGGEAELVAGTREVLRNKVAYLVIGSHSRQIEGRLFDMLLADGWRLEMERPAILVLTDSGPVVSVDGVQGWRNPRLLP
jgi:hypothetical protein